MKILPFRLGLVLLASAGVFLAPTVNAATVAPIKPAEPSAFQSVTAKLDPGGSLYLYVSTDQWLANLSPNIAELRQLILAIPDLDATDRATLRRVFTVLDGLIRQSGIESLAGIGISGVAVEKDLYRTRVVLQRAPGASADGYLWTLFGTAPHPLTGLDWLPPDTAWAFFADIDLKQLWTAIGDIANAAHLEPVLAAMVGMSTQVQQLTGRSIEQHLDSFGGEIGLAIGLDLERSIEIPFADDATVALPEPSLLIGLKMNDDHLFNWIDAALGQNPDSTRGEIDGARWRALDVPLPLPISFRPTVARSGDYLWLASHQDVFERIHSIHSGQAPGLKSTREFERLSQNLPDQGNHFAFVSERFVETLTRFQRAAFQQAEAQGGPPAALMERMLQFAATAASYSVGWQDTDGSQSVSLGTQEPATVLVASALVAPTAMMAGMALPAVAKAKSRASEIRCVNNLKQIGLAMFIYASDHDDTFPPDYRSISEYLVDPRILICPEDPNIPALDRLSWSDLDAIQTSYEYLIPGISTSENPTTVVARCRIHGTRLFLDGSVHQTP